jgi:hypothetical protein
MLRALVVAALLTLLPLCADAQERPRSEDNPLVNDPYWQFQVGIERSAQLQRTLAGNPTPSQAIAAHFGLGSKVGALRAARGLLSADAGELAEGLRLLIEPSYGFDDDGTSLRADWISFLADARRRVMSFPPREGADAAYQLLYLENSVNRGDEAAHERRVAEFLATYDGTPAVTLYKIGQVESSNPRDDAGNVQRFRDLAREHGDTVAGAMALHLLAFRQGHPPLSSPDPTERLLEVFEVVKQLESGRFPKGRWVDNAAELVSDFYFGLRTEIPPASVPRIYARYLDFILTHPGHRGRYAGGEAIDWMIRNGVAKLGADGPSRIATVERLFEDLEKGGFGVNNVRFLRARFYLTFTRPEMLDPVTAALIDPKEADVRARYSLRVMIESADPTAVARARAALAGHDWYNGRYAEARSYFTHLANLPAAEWTWVAALRAAEMREALGEAAGAAADYESIATKFSSSPAAVALARVAAADAYESITRYDAAALNLKAAVAAWQVLPDVVRIHGMRSDRARPSPADRRYVDLKKAALVARADRLAASVGPDGALLHEGRRALEIEQPAAALKPLRLLLAEYPRSAKASEARALLRRARFESALSLKGAEATRELDALSRGPYDAVVSLSKLATAATLLRRGQRGQAEALTKTALEEWRARQPPPSPKTALEQDVAAIRAELFKPKGGGVYGTEGWNAFDWPSGLPPLLLVNRDVVVKTSDGIEATYSVAFTPPSGARVLFLGQDEFKGLELILDGIGGTETRQPERVMDTPNQPIGGSVEIASMWSKFFPLRQGHWAGWELGAYPYVSKIHFDRDGHALAEVTIGYSGGTFELEKENGVWVAKRMVSMWIT